LFGLFFVLFFRIIRPAALSVCFSILIYRYVEDNLQAMLNATLLPINSVTDITSAIPTEACNVVKFVLELNTVGNGIKKSSHQTFRAYPPEIDLTLKLCRFS
jgi:hypothetical protein